MRNIRKKIKSLHIWKSEWVRNLSNDHVVYVSEYSAPDDFKCVWEKVTSSLLSANGKSGGSKQSTEKLFIYQP